ncbi:MAG: hypothetical protein EBR82_21600 [Caulobacteraceae bacterium]|nr:hypothetical protein [Caulobacteraceae bacterium]
MEPIDLRPKKSEMSDNPMISAFPSDCCPTVYLNGSKDLADLPKEGTITFKYKRSELSMRDRDNKPVSVTLSLKEIVDAIEDTENDEEDMTDEEDMDSGDALDKKMKSALNDEEIDD